MTSTRTNKRTDNVQEEKHKSIYDHQQDRARSDPESQSTDALEVAQKVELDRIRPSQQGANSAACSRRIRGFITSDTAKIV
jgi:hypothetical protein